MADGNMFDAQYYAENNTDVAAVLGTDETVLYNNANLKFKENRR